MVGEDIIRMSMRELIRLQVLKHCEAKIVHQALDRQITQKAGASMLALSERLLTGDSKGFPRNG